MPQIQIAGLGAMNMDLFLGVERMVLDGEVVTQDFGKFPGGSAANTIYALAKLRVTTSFWGAVGADEEGQALLQDLASVGVDTSGIRVKEGNRTGIAVGISEKGGRRALYLMPGANDMLDNRDVRVESIAQAEFLYLSSFAGEKQFSLQGELVSGLPPSVRVCLSPGALYASRGLGQLSPLLRRTHVLFLNHEELRQLASADLTQGTEQCLEQGCRVVVVTLGGRRRSRSGKGFKGEGASAVCYIREGDKEYLIPRSDRNMLPVIDTTGAGDAFAAGFLFALLKGKDMEGCGLLGDLMARFCIARPGARAGLPTLSELARKYEELHHEPLSL